MQSNSSSLFCEFCQVFTHHHSQEHYYDPEKVSLLLCSQSLLLILWYLKIIGLFLFLQLNSICLVYSLTSRKWNLLYIAFMSFFYLPHWSWDLPMMLHVSAAHFCCWAVFCCVDMPSFIYSLVDGDLGCFLWRLLWIKAAMSFESSVCIGYIFLSCM